MSRTIYGAICTYKRHIDLTIMLDSLADQTRQLDHLVIVDNADDPQVIDLVANHHLTNQISIDIVGARTNPGPAGAFALAHEQLASLAHDDDLFITFDDDDPPTSHTLLEDLCQFADSELHDERVAGVGLRGGVLNKRTGMIAPRPAHPEQHDGPTSEHADHLHGNWFPCYRFGALGDISGFDTTMFWGFEELDVGRRLAAKGYSLKVASELYRSVATTRPQRRLFAPLPAKSWRHFYRHRNLIRILRRDRAWGGLIATIALRLLAKPLIATARSPRLGLWHLRTNIEAISDGLRTHPTAKHHRHLPTTSGAQQPQSISSKA